MTFGTFGKCEVLNCNYVGVLFAHTTTDGCTHVVCEECAVNIRGQEIEEGDHASEWLDATREVRAR